ncbi:defensin-like protein AX1 [Spinacia oleracea]|uniref:Defensin-like protein AX1 n=1 Tax=Spinacia oleracea TaxID=3562 RepID=A0A9R0IMR0_SPIOL|nr:defensin-like protein AX1 [Spinacia oleracea]
MEKKYFGLLFLVLFFFASEMKMVVEVEGATCAKPSKFFKGGCFSGFSTPACRNACSQEGWPTGICVPVFRCECRRTC